MWAAVSPNERWLAMIGADGIVACWDLPSHRRLGTFGPRFSGVGGFLRFSPDSRLLAACSAEGVITVWELPGGRSVLTAHGNLGTVFGLGFAPDGRRLLSGGSEPADAVRLIDLGGKPYMARSVATLTGTSDAVWFVEMSPDGNLIAASGYGGTTLLWRAPSWAEIEAKEHKTER
jgi:WD40 repeat protein